MNALSHELTRIGRRSFLVSLGGISVGIAFNAVGATSTAEIDSDVSDIELNPWIKISTDGWITIVSPGSEMGQGTMTALPMCVAEEMDADWSHVRVIQAPNRPAYGNPAFNGLMTTGGSRTTRGYFQLMRVAGAQARQVLLQTVAKAWQVPVDELTAHSGSVFHPISHRKLTYGEVSKIVEIPKDFPKAATVALKHIDSFKYIGKDTVSRVDIPDKTTGKAKFGIDTRLPGMVYGAIARAPAPGISPLEFNDSKAKAVRGYIKSVRLPYGVGVLATNTWAALQARYLLEISWSNSSKALSYNSTDAKIAYRDIARNIDTKGVVVEEHGDAKVAIKDAFRVLKADFVSGHMAHATMEPMNATAQFTNGKLEVWAPTQSPSLATMTLAGAMKLKPENIEVHVTLLGGGFGRRTESDFVVDAGLLAREANGAPVKVTWSREDDVRHDRPRPLVAQHLEVGLDQHGKIIGWHHRIVSETIYGRLLPGAYKAGGGKDAPVHEGAELLYATGPQLVEFLRQDSGMEVGFWRGVGGGYTKFASESMVDEVARGIQADPIAFRIDLLRSHPRAQSVLRNVAKLAKWDETRPVGRALGVAYSDMWGTHIAVVAEVSVDKKEGRVIVHKVWAAVDPGIALLPTNVARQIEGGIIWGLSAALMQELTYKNGVAEQSNFGDYPVPRMAELPTIEVKVFSTDNPPSGLGEAGVPAIAPAIAAAVYRLTGYRLNSLPFEVDKLKISS